MANNMMLTDESNSSKAGYDFSAQAHLSLSSKTKVPGIFGTYRSAKNGHTFAAISEYSNWESTGIKKDFWDQLEDGVNALESSLSRRISVHMPHTVEFCPTDAETPPYDGCLISALPWRFGGQL
jgi:hypothetical protein